MEGFRIDLETFLTLDMSEQCCLTLIESKYQSEFGVIFWSQNPLTFMIPIHSTTYFIKHYCTVHVVA